MIFGSVSLDEALGAYSAHGLKTGDLVLKKGALITEDLVGRLRRAGLDTIVVARLGPDDVHEDVAAGDLAVRAAGEGVRVDPAFTGRANLFASEDGVLVVDRDRIDAVNALDEAITLATLPEFKPVVAGEMIGTVKIIPYGVGRASLDEACRIGHALLGVRPYRPTRIAVVSTLTPGFKASIVDKSLTVLAERLKPAGAVIVQDHRVPHEADALAARLATIAEEEADLLIVFGASAIADRRDVIPAGIERAGGRIEHFGMPVDPGNLLLVGWLGERPVLGAPGCARSPKENGFDWILTRLLAGIPVTRRDITRLASENS